MSVASRVAIGCLQVMVVFLAASGPGSQAFAREVTTAELQALSPVCQALLGKGKAARAERLRPVSHLMVGSCGIIHTCGGELALLRYQQFSSTRPPSSGADARANFERQRSHLLQTAIAEFGYEIKCAPPTYPMLPMILTQRGKAFSFANKHKEASTDFARALQLDPNYAPARQGLAASQARAAIPSPRK